MQKQQHNLCCGAVACGQREERGLLFRRPLRNPRDCGSIGSSYGDGKPSRRCRAPVATVPICSGYRSGYGREIGPWCRRSEIAPLMCGCRETGKAVRATGRPFSVAWIYPEAVSLSRAAARPIFSTRRACDGAIFSFMKARISGGAVSGEPELNGGAGLYSSRSWIASAV
jgi:hypothetical protein